MSWELAVSLVACTASAGACIIVGVEFAITNTFAALASGEGLSEAALTAGIGLGVGIATGGLVSHFGGNAIVGLLAGIGISRCYHRDCERSIR